MNVSIVIPTYNRLPILEKCLFALENQKLNTNISNYEVIVLMMDQLMGQPHG